MKWLKKGLIFVFILTILLSSFITFLVGTTIGMKLVLHTVIKSIPSVYIQKIEGTLHDGSLTGVHYTTPGITININKVHFKLSYRCLIDRKLYMNAVMLKKVNILVDKNWPSSQITHFLSEKKNYKYYISYCPVRLKRVAIYDVKIKLKNTGISLVSFIGGIKWKPQELILTPSHLQGLTISLPQTKIEESKKQISIYNIDRRSINPSYTYTHVGKIIKTLWNTTLIQYLPIFNLPIHVNLMTIFCENLNFIGNTHTSIDTLLIQATIKNQQLYLKNLVVDAPGGSIQSYGHMKLHGTWPLNFILHGMINVAGLKDETIQANLNGDLCGNLKLVCKLSGSVQALLNLHTQLALSKKPVYIQLKSSALFWPLYGITPFRAHNVNFLFRGDLSDYSVSLAADLQGQYMPSIMLIANGKGNTDKLIINTLQLKSLKNKTEFKGQITWKESLNWYGKFKFSDVTTNNQNADRISPLKGEIITHGSLYTRKHKIPRNHIWQAQNPGIWLQATGKLFHNPLKIYGSLSAQGLGQCHIPIIKLNLGGNTLTIKGVVNKKVNLHIDINAKNLKNFIPECSGSARGNLHVQGDLTELRFLMNGSANHLRWRDTQIARIQYRGSIIANNKIQSEITLRVEKLKQKKVVINFLQLRAIGTVMKHILEINLKGNQTTSKITIQGSLDPIAGRWSGTCPNAYFSNTLGEWRSTNNITFDFFYEKQMFHLWSGFFKRTDVTLPLINLIKPDKFGHLKISLRHINLAMFNMFLPMTAQLSGELNTGYADIILNSHASLSTGVVSVIGSNIMINHNIIGHNIPIILNKFQLDLAFKNQCMQLQWRISIANNGSADGKIQVSDLSGKRVLIGDLNVNSLSMGLLSSVLMPGETISGVVNTHLRLGGSLKKPQIFGKMLLSNASFDGHLIPIKLITAKMAILFKGVTSNLEGVVQTEQGRIVFHGITDWRRLSHWYTRISVTGDKIRITVPPILKMDIVPDLTFTAMPKSLTLAGDIHIPWARCLVQTAPLTISKVSSDEILLDSDLKPITPQSMTAPITSRLTVHVGDDVMLNAFGVQGKLHGNVKITQDKHGLGVHGQMKILSGRFHAYAQDLAIRRGELQFSGLFDQPYLNIEAIRNPESTTDDVTVGVRITGLANDPKFEIFSDPEQTQESALSYLLRGQKLTSASGDGYALTSTLISLGLERSENIISKIGQIVRVKNLSMATIGAGDKQQVQVSAYILPSLQIKYGFGIFDTLETFTIRYQLMPKLYLEAMSSLDQAIDVLYQFEF
ncbi:Translocation and assembly module subunit TamB [Candidatus Erwinia haradaeae]|uniref:Translocation and assembly module subunit TamB n=1 Tax=Candidatus Erwinia haradaeae TaxID=1922217 RepID=A0A451DJA8_9GAMM|nr:translocation/assembly module TamB domain-containing protein [Candidatus Erwinia haradaeae]VFP86790.1 Translocation and assembly module subunit TamB [Candidatus Erwinia haradaeae]